MRFLGCARDAKGVFWVDGLGDLGNAVHYLAMPYITKKRREEIFLIAA
jgi:hypothetical protein